MGQHVWLLLATILTELLVITKWSKGQFTEPLPMHIRWAWAIGGILLVLYPALRVSASLVFRRRWLKLETVWRAEHTEVCPKADAEAEREGKERAMRLHYGFYLVYTYKITCNYL
jgi:hypothetical protein